MLPQAAGGHKGRLVIIHQNSSRQCASAPWKSCPCRLRMVWSTLLLTSSRFLPNLVAPAAVKTLHLPHWQVPQHTACAPAPARSRAHRQSRLAAHPADLAVFSLMDGDGSRAAFSHVPPSVPGPGPGAMGSPSSVPHGGQPLSGPSPPVARHRDPVLLLDLMAAGGCSRCIQASVVGQQQQALGVHVQPPHGEHPRAAVRPPAPPRSCRPCSSDRVVT